MLLLILEIGLLVYGVIALVTGKISLGRNRVSTGIPARFAGAIFLLPLPMAFSVGFVVGFVNSLQGNPNWQKDWHWPLIAIEAGLALGALVLGLLVASLGVTTTDPPGRRRRRPYEDDDDDFDARPRRRRNDDFDDDFDDHSNRPVAAVAEDGDGIQEEVRPRRPARLDPPRRERERRREPDVAKPFVSRGALITGGIVLVLGLAAVGAVFGTYLYYEASNPAVQPQAGVRPGFGQMQPPVVVQPQPLPPPPPVVRPGWHDAVPRRVELTQPKQELTFLYDANDPRDPQVAGVARLYLLPLTANRPVLVECGEDRQFNQGLRMRLEDLDASRVVWSGNEQLPDKPSSLFFLPAKTALYRLVVTSGEPTPLAYKVVFRQVEHKDRLPTLTVPEPPPVTPVALKLAKRIDPFVAGTFAQDSKSAWVVDDKRVLRKYTVPGFEEEGRWPLGRDVTQLAFAGEQLCAAVVRKRGVAPTTGEGDLHVFDPGKMPASGAEPKASKVIPLGGMATQLVPSPNGRWLYFLNPGERKLGMIEADTWKLKWESHRVDLAADAMCLTPDGEWLYTTGKKNNILRVNARTLEVTALVELDRCEPVDLRATTTGYVFLAPSSPGLDMSYVVNAFEDSRPNKVTATWYDMRHKPAALHLSADQKRLYALRADGSRVIAYQVHEWPTVIKALTAGEVALPGGAKRMVVSPDERYLITDAGEVVGLGR